MKNLLLLLLFNSFFLVSLSQNRPPKEYVAFDNSIFTQGDSVFIGFYSGYKGFNYVVQSYYNSKFDNGYRKLKGNVVGTKHQILDIYKDDKAIFDTSAYVLEVGVNGLLKGYKLYININQAVKSGEVILSQSPLKEPNRSIQYYTDSVAFLYRVKQSNKPVSDFALEYLFHFNNKSYKKYRNDEFELDNQKQIATEEIKRKLDQVADSTTYCIDVNLKFDNYDFSSMSFPLDGYNKSYIVLKTLNRNVHPSTHIVFINQEEFSRVMVEKEIANGFIKRKKDRYGNVDRTVYAKVYFKNTDTPSNEYNQNVYTETKFETYLYAKISRIEFYDFENRKYNYLGQITTNP